MEKKVKNSEEEAISLVMSEVVVKYWVGCCYARQKFDSRCQQEHEGQAYSDTEENKMDFKVKLQQRGWTFVSNRGWVCPNCLESTAMPRRQKLFWK